MAEKLRSEIRGNVALVTIDNPPANTWDADNLGALTGLMDVLNANKEVYSLVVTGEGQKFFSAGADLNMFSGGDKVTASDMAERFGRAFEALSHFRGVSIAAINGYAMGGGLECALACDIRIAEEQVQVALPEASVGLLPCGGGTQNLAWTVGEGWAKRMILMGERLDADTAAHIGLIEEVVPEGTVVERAMALAKQVGKQSPLAVTACKQLIQAARAGNISDAYITERKSFVELFDTEDQAEGVNAFLEKRSPHWKNA